MFCPDLTRVLPIAPRLQKPFLPSLLHSLERLCLLVQAQNPPSPFVPVSPALLFVLLQLTCRSPSSHPLYSLGPCLPKSFTQPLSAFPPSLSAFLSVTPLTCRSTFYQGLHSHRIYLRSREGKRRQRTKQPCNEAKTMISTPRNTQIIMSLYV